MDVFLDSVKTVSVIVMTAYPFTWVASIQRSLSMEPTAKDKFVLILIFSALAVCGNWTSVEVFNRAILNSGMVAPVVGGIIAGPVVGLGSGVIGGLHRATLGGFTMVPDCLSIILAGGIGGIFYWRFRKKRMIFGYSFLAGIFASAFANALILVMAEPQILAVTFVKMTGISSTFVNGMGTGIFTSIVHNVQSRQYSIGTSYAKQATEIARKVLPVIRGNLDTSDAREIVKIIHDAGMAHAIAITDGKIILAFAGHGEETHTPGSPDLAFTQNLSVKTEEIWIANKKEKVGCPIPDCPHDAVIIVPLFHCNEQAWFLHVYKVHDVVHPPDIKLVTGVANLLNLQYQNARLEHQAQLLARAEYAALRSQVNPHFLFNTLSAIKLQIRENPAKAQDMILTLASFFRRTLEINEDLIPLAEEMKCVQFYLNIQQARFEDRLQVDYDISPECMSFHIPSFVIQPLVENCFNHGFAANGNSLEVKIIGRYTQGIFSIRIEDNGSGIPLEVIEAVKADKTTRRMGVGLTNVNRRLKSIYGHHYSFYLETREPGAAVGFTIRTEDKL